MVGTAWRLTYTDSGGTKQTIAELGQDTGAKNIDRIRYILNRKNPWIMKVFTDPSLLAAFPNEVTEFQNSEPEILFEEYDGSWTTRGRFYSASQTNEDNEFAIQLLDFYHKLMKQEVSVSSTTTHIVDVLEKALPSGYVVDAPASGDVSGGYPSVDDYSCKNTQRRKVFREITRDHNWSLFFLPEQDGSNNWKVRFEPDGYGGTVENLDSSTDSFKFKNWKPPRNKNLVTKTRVQGVDSNGNQIVGTAQNTTIRDKYLGTNSTDHNFKSFKVGYLESQSEADTIAQNRLIPGLNATSVKDSGVISNIIYPQDVVNDSFGIIDSFRDIDDTFTCVKQENFYPSNESYLHMEFEQEKLEEAAEGEENLRDERARLYPSSSKNASGNTGNTEPDTKGSAGDTGPNTSGQAGNSSPQVSGDTTSEETALGTGIGSDSDTGTSIDSFTNVSGQFNLSGYVNKALKTVEVRITPNSSEEIRVRVKQGGIVRYDAWHFMDSGHENLVTFTYKPNESSTGDGELELASNSGSNTVDWDIQFIQEEPHAHSGGPSSTLDADFHPHSLDSGTTDGDGQTITAGVDNHPHSIETGTTDASGNTIDAKAENHNHDGSTIQVDVNEEDKTDR